MTSRAACERVNCSCPLAERRTCSALHARVWWLMSGGRVAARAGVRAGSGPGAKRREREEALRLCVCVVCVCVYVCVCVCVCVQDEVA
jgi:hypothetical protein